MVEEKNENMEPNSSKLSNAQIEIVKAFRHDMTEEDLKKFRKIIANFFAEILMDEADKVWDEEGWDEEKIQELLNTKMRSGHKQQGE